MTIRRPPSSFEKATVVYPQYDAAYDNLGVTYMQLGTNRQGARGL